MNNDNYVLLPIEFHKFVDLWKRLDKSTHKYGNYNDEDRVNLLFEIREMFNRQYEQESCAGQIYDAPEEEYSPE